MSKEQNQQTYYKKIGKESETNSIYLQWFKTVLYVSDSSFFMSVLMKIDIENNNSRLWKEEWLPVFCASSEYIRLEGFITKKTIHYCKVYCML